MTTRCDYCGTGLRDDEEEVEDATGERHYVSKCREYVFQVKEHAKAEVADLRAKLAVFQADHEAAAGELRVPLESAHPGSTIAKLLSANSIMRQERDRLRVVAEMATAHQCNRRKEHVDCGKCFRCRARAALTGSPRITAR